MKTKISTLLFYIYCCISILCLSGCSISLYKPKAVTLGEDLQIEYQPTDMITEICICHSANPDGSALLWSDRVEDKKFFVFAIPNELGLQMGDEIAITYSEDTRLHAKHTDNKSNITYYLKNGEFTLSAITPAILNQAIDGSRKNKYLKMYDLNNDAPSESYNTSEDTLATDAIEETDTNDDADYQPDYEDIHEEFYIDNTALSENGTVVPAIYTVTHRGFKSITINGEKYHLKPDMLFAFALVEYSASGTSYFGTINGVPAKDTTLLYLNQRGTLSAGIITEVNTAPNNLYTIQMQVIALQNILE